MFAQLKERVAEKIKALTLDQQEKDINDLVEKATAESLPAADWGLNMELVDIINGDPAPASDKTCKALKRALAKPSVHCQVLTLTLLETIVKNTSGSFHHFFVRSELWQDLLAVGAAPRAFDPEVRDKILGLIEDFARGVPVPQYREAYEQLLDAGTDFPVRPEGEAVPYYTPPSRPSDALAGVSAEDRAAIQEAMRQMDAEEQAEAARAAQQQASSLAMAAPTFAMAAPHMPHMPAPSPRGAPGGRGTPPPQRSPTPPARPEELMQVGGAGGGAGATGPGAGWLGWVGVGWGRLGRVGVPRGRGWGREPQPLSARCRLGAGPGSLASCCVAVRSMGAPADADPDLTLTLRPPAAAGAQLVRPAARDAAAHQPR
jgi:hypothetical protein